MATQFQPVRSDQSNFNIKELFFKYLRFLPMFILSISLALGIAFIYLRYSPSVYGSGGSLVLKDQKSETVQGDEKFQQLFVNDRSKNMQNEVEYLRAQPLMERVVTALNLNYSYYAKGKIKEQNIYKDAPFHLEPILIKDSSTFRILLKFKSGGSFSVNSSDQHYSFGQTFTTPNGVFRLVRDRMAPLNAEYRITWKPTSSMAGFFRKTLSVIPKAGGSGIMNITLEAENPYLAADIVNQLMTEYQQATIEDKNRTTKQMLDFIDGRLKIVSGELDSVTNKVLIFQKASGIPNIQSAEGSYLSKADDSESELEKQRLQLKTLELISRYLADGKNNYSMVPTSLSIDDATLGGLIAAYNSAQLERQVMLDSNIPLENPRIKQKEDQLDKLRTSILENIRNIRSAYNSNINSLSLKNSTARAQLRSLPEKEQILSDLRRQQASKLSIYTLLTTKREESAISLAATISNIKVLEKANPNTIPLSPKPRAIQTIALVLGLIIPALIVLLIELFDDKVSTREDIEKLTTATILGEVGHSSLEQTLVVTAKSRGFVSEQFRIIRSNLQYVITDIPKPVILVTSSFSGEGKSFISTNLGAVIALTGKKVIVLEFDIRKPKILSGLNIPKRPGLSNYLLGMSELKDLPIPVENHENLYVLACGPVPPNPAEILLNSKMDDLMVYLKENFDVVIMDTAPVGMVSDALTLSKYADCSIYIVRQGVTHKKQINLLEEFNKEQKLPKVNIILNDIKSRAGYGYYYGRYGYGYGYGTNYGYGYYDDEKQGTVISRWFGWVTNSKNGTAKKRKKATN
jgi:tyrosine-protein kinase Etk/Wzc